MYKEVKTMRKLGKRLNTNKETIQAFCYCDPSQCWSNFHNTALTATMGINNTYGY